MTGILRSIASNSFWFYLVCLLGGAVLFVLFFRAQQNARQALFGLEVEVANARRQRALRMMLLLFLLAMTVVFITTFVEPYLPAETLVEPTATLDFFASPPPTFSNITPTATATLTATLTIATETPSVAGPQPGEPGDEQTTDETLTPTEEAPPPIDLPGSVCYFISPADGSTVSGEVTFIGSANAQDFMFYKLEAYGPETSGVWASLLGDVVSVPANNSALGTVNFGAWAAGVYSIRMVVVDSTSNEVASCYISLNLPSP